MGKLKKLIMENNSQKNITPTLVFIFGGSGDLNNRKLTPALFNLFADGFLDANFKIFGIGRTEFDDYKFRNHLRRH